jgi:hypothetical protein
MDELYALAEEHDGLFTFKEARGLGVRDSVLESRGNCLTSGETFS